MNESPKVFSESDVKTHEYRRISGLAITTLILSVIGCLVVISNKNFVFLQLCVAALAITTLILLHRSIKPVSGHWLAAVALFVSLFSFSTISAYHQYKYNRLEKTAIAHGQTWLNLLKQKRAHQAYQLYLPAHERQEIGTDLQSVYGDVENPVENLRRYLELEPEKSIMSDGESANLKLDRITHDIPGARTDDFVLLYDYQRSNEPEPRLVSCYLRRIDSLITGPQWHVVRVKQLEPRIKRVLPRELEDSLFNQ